LEKNASEVEKSKIFEILDFKIFFLFFSIFKLFLAPGQWPITTGLLRQFFSVLKLLFYLFKSRSNDKKTFWKKFLKFTLKWHFPLFWALDPPKVAFESQSCWHTGIQVIICLGFHGEGFWVKKGALQSTLKMPVFAKNQVLKLF